MRSRRPRQVELRLSLADAPRVWRAVRMSHGATLSRAQRVFCVLFGWSGGRPYSFASDDLVHESSRPDRSRDEPRLRHFLPDAGRLMDFEYGDHPWHVIVCVERFLPPLASGAPPTCLGGEGEAPHVDADHQWDWFERTGHTPSRAAQPGREGAPRVRVNVDAINAELTLLP